MIIIVLSLLLKTVAWRRIKHFLYTPRTPLSRLLFLHIWFRENLSAEEADLLHWTPGIKREGQSYQSLRQRVFLLLLLYFTLFYVCCRYSSGCLVLVRFFDKTELRWRQPWQTTSSRLVVSVKPYLGFSLSLSRKFFVFLFLSRYTFLFLAEEWVAGECSRGTWILTGREAEGCERSRREEGRAVGARPER